MSIANPVANIPGGIVNGVGQTSYRVQVFLFDTDWIFPTPPNSPPYMEVQYIVGDLTIDARVDSMGRLFIYLPVGTPPGNGVMVFSGDTFLEVQFDLTSGHDNNVLVLSLDGNPAPPPPPPPYPGYPTPPPPPPPGPGPDDPGNGPPPSEVKGPLWFQTGANSNQGLFVWIERLDTMGIGLRDTSGNHVVDVVKQSGEEISQLIDILDDGLEITNNERATLGAIQNRLEYTERSLSISSENLSDAESRVRNADMAREMMDFMQMNVLFQAGMLMLSQANQLPNTVLQLLQN